VYSIVRNGSASGNQRKHLYDKHADMKILLQEIESQLMEGKNWRAAVAPLRDEEKTVFPELRRQLADSAFA
jgi:hypothetical protein